MTWSRYGEAAIDVDLGVEDAPDRAARTHAAAAAVRAQLDPAAAEVIVGAGTILVASLGAGWGADIEAVLAAAASPAAIPGPGTQPGRVHEIQVVYDGPDLEEVAAAIGASPDEVIAWHAGREVVAELLGFLPGFAYLGGLDERLVRPRRASPRPIVPAGSVGVAGGFTGVYPFASPGGWSLLGRAVGVAMFDPEGDPPARIAPGDRVRFVPVPANVASALATSAGRGSAPAVPAGAGTTPARAIEVLAAPAGATVQDAGRPGQLSKGLPPSGPLDWVTHAAANLAVGNAAGAAAIEIPLGGMEIRALGDLVVSVDGEQVRVLRHGERLSVPPGPHAVRYLAVLGGIAVPVRLGARATLLVARLGGVDGRPLARGDRIPVSSEPEAAPPRGGDVAPGLGMGAEGALVATRSPDVDLHAGGADRIAVDPGPHAARFPGGAFDALLTTAWRVSRWGDRVGVRLEGGRVPREGPDLALPAPMLRGAVQVATDGTPIVLGPDHPVTGGYPVLAVVRRADQPRLARLRPGEEVRFQRGR